VHDDGIDEELRRLWFLRIGTAVVMLIECARDGDGLGDDADVLMPDCRSASTTAASCEGNFSSQRRKTTSCLFSNCDLIREPSW